MISSLVVGFFIASSTILTVLDTLLNPSSYSKVNKLSFILYVALIFIFFEV